MGIRCLIVDDSAAFCAVAERVLTSQGICVVGVARDSAQAITDVEVLQPDVVLVDVYLGSESGFALARRIHALARAANRSVDVILISTHAEEDLLDLVRDSPARAFLDKGELSARTIRTVLDGNATPRRPNAN